MKKLFSTMLAATMVAGMSVSAFAKQQSIGMTTADFDTQDYGLIGAYNDEGKSLKNSDAKLDGGDKIYFPILISGDEIDDDNLAGSKDMYFADKASEVKNLKASVKDEIGGKYIDSASIVKKDIKIDRSATQITSGEKAKFSVDLAGSSVAAATTGADDDGILTLSIGGVTVKSAEYDMVTGALADGSAVAAKLAAGTVTGGYKVTASGSVLTFEADAVGLGTITAANTATIAIDSGNDVTTPGAIVQATKNTAKVINAGAAPTGDVNTATKKIYCVEVKIADYFKNEETEVDFNITLKNSGRTEFNSDDNTVTEDNGAFFNGTFDLGKDSEMFDLSVAGKEVQNGAKATKFKNGDLKIEIGKDTKTLQLDEAKTTAGKVEDVDNIFIENNKSIDNAFTFDVKASSQDDLYLELNQDAIKDLAVSNSKADLTFFNFPGTPEFDFTGKATFAVEDEDEDNYFYEVIDGELVESRAKYNKEDGVFELRTNKLGSYVISDKELKVSEGKEEDDAENKEQEGTGGDATVDATTGANGEKGNANTGAADLIGVASALAVVSIAAAGAVALKK